MVQKSTILRFDLFKLTGMGKMNKWMNEWMSEWINEWINTWIEEWAIKKIKE